MSAIDDRIAELKGLLLEDAQLAQAERHEAAAATRHEDLLDALNQIRAALEQRTSAYETRTLALVAVQVFSNETGLGVDNAIATACEIVKAARREVDSK